MRQDNRRSALTWLGVPLQDLKIHEIAYISGTWSWVMKVASRTEIIELPRRLRLLCGAPSGGYQIGVPSLSRKTKVSLPRVTSRAKMVSTLSNCTLVPTTVTSSPLLNTRS
jgi:hypothetical protein